MCRLPHIRALRGPSSRLLKSIAVVFGLALFFGVLGAGTGTGERGYRSEVLADAPVGYWRLGERTGLAARDTARKLAGRYRGTPSLGRPGALAGDANPAVGFDAVDDEVQIAGMPALGPSKGLTIELWVRPAVRRTRQMLISRRAGRRATFDVYRVWIDRSNRPRASFADRRAGMTLRGTKRLGAGWHHVVATYGGGVARLYVDGRLQTERRAKLALRSGRSPAFLARSSTGGDRFRGTLDEVAIYRRALDPGRIKAHYRAARRGLSAPPVAFPLDVTPPAVTLTQPFPGETVSSATPMFAGEAGTEGGDSPVVTVRVYTGSTATGAPLQSLTATPQAEGAYFVTAQTGLPSGTYTVRASQSDAAGNTGNSNPVTFTVAVGSGNDPVFIGAGDIAGCGSELPGAAATAAILGQHPDATVFTLGDNAYEHGSAADYACYDQTWGAHKARTRPIIGDHDLETNGASNYLSYFAARLAPFGPTATDPTKMYYSYDLGTWHVVALNAVCAFYTPGCSPAGQEAWFAADLAAHPNKCTLVLMHSPRFSSGNIHGSNPGMQGLWAAAANGGADVILSGDEHVYERFAPMDYAGKLDNQYGVRQFIVGTGGYLLYGFSNPVDNSEVRYSQNFGVIKLTLRSGAYDWQFIPIDGLPSPDTGTATCH